MTRGGNYSRDTTGWGSIAGDPGRNGFLGPRLGAHGDSRDSRGGACRRRRLRRSRHRPAAGTAPHLTAAMLQLARGCPRRDPGRCRPRDHDAAGTRSDHPSCPGRGSPCPGREAVHGYARVRSGAGGPGRRQRLDADGQPELPLLPRRPDRGRIGQRGLAWRAVRGLDRLSPQRPVAAQPVPPASHPRRPATADRHVDPPLRSATSHPRQRAEKHHVRGVEPALERFSGSLCGGRVDTI